MGLRYVGDPEVAIFSFNVLFGYNNARHSRSSAFRIDTSGRGVNFGALFNKVWISCSLRDYHVLYIMRL